MTESPSELDGLTGRLRQGDAAAAEELSTRCRDRLNRMVRLRLDRYPRGSSGRDQ
jgi:hypothetical protein